MITSENAAFYIKTILRTERPSIVKEFASQLHKKLKLIRNNLDRKNIKLVSINRMPLSEGDAESYFFHAVLNEELRRKGVFAFVINDDSKKIYISIDKLYFIDHDHPDVSLRESAAMDMVDTYFLFKA